MKVIIVGFKVKEENSVGYLKVEIKSDDSWRRVRNYLENLANKGADFVSIRFVR